MSETKVEISVKTLSKVQLTAIAARLQLSTDDVLGKCVRLWLWAKINSSNGFIAQSTFATIDESFHCPGFASALEENGWLRVRENGVEFPNFDRLAGGPGGTKTAARMRRMRERKRNALRNGERNAVTPLLCISSSSQDEVLGGAKAKSSPKAGGFVKPTVEEVGAYCSERKNKVNPEQFIDYYESNGWKVGKVPMRNWKSAVRNWEKNNFATKTRQRVGSGRVELTPEMRDRKINYFDPGPEAEPDTGTPLFTEGDARSGSNPKTA